MIAKTADLDQKLPLDIAARGSDSHAQADFTCAFGNRDQLIFMMLIPPTMSETDATAIRRISRVSTVVARAWRTSAGCRS